ncbi:MAG: hypothetical protein H7Y10_03645 [Flavobacterium sp.]|nr:hypothetical protein [Flavobacterium sp.]
MTPSEEFKDFQRELREKEEIRAMPWNGLSRSALLNVKKSEISKKLDKQYENMTLSEFFEATSIKPNYGK